MNLNAEVALCGGIHPGSKVWIDGKPVSLSPDGTFRCYFKFPEGDYSIAIVAESPDGKEQRSASLRLARNTTQSGDEQPNLGAEKNMPRN